MVVCLGELTDSSETRSFVPMSARQSVHGMPVIAGSIELARRYRTSYQRPPGSHITSQERYKTTNILAFGVQAQAAEDVFEWLQPSGRRPEGCCRSTELSGGRGQLPEVADYRLRRTMHAPCMPRLTLADVWRRQPESHESFELACRNAAGRCSTSVSMCSTRAVQRKQRRSDAEGRECSSPRTHRGAPAALWTLWSDASGHNRPIPPTCGLF